MSEAAGQLDRLVPPAVYQSARRHVFPSEQAQLWHMRKHRRVLDEAGAVIVVNRRLLIDPEHYDAVVVAEGRRSAQARPAQTSVDLPFACGERARAAVTKPCRAQREQQPAGPRDAALGQHIDRRLLPQRRRWRRK